jgi:hypothetical protein
MVKDASGQSQHGIVAITFALYKDEQGGAPLWLETQNVQTDTQGRYSVYLGATKPDGLPQDLFASGEARWLGVQPDGQGEWPRTLLLSVPYALKTGDAEILGAGFGLRARSASRVKTRSDFDFAINAVRTSLASEVIGKLGLRNSVLPFRICR